MPILNDDHQAQTVTKKQHLVGLQGRQEKGISNLGRDVKRIFRSFDRVEEKPIPSHQRTLTHAMDKATVAQGVFEGKPRHQQ